MRRRKTFLVVGTVALIFFTVYFIERNKVKNSITINNQTDVIAPKMTFYLTQSNSADNSIVKGDKFGEISPIAPKESLEISSDTEVTEDSNVVFEYTDATGSVIVDYVNDYLPFDSKKYEMQLELIHVNSEGTFEYN